MNEQYVYFATTGLDHRQPVKIGVSFDPDKRLSQLSKQLGESVYLLVDTPGGYDVEQKYHETFAAGRLDGEWFDPDTPGLREEMERLKNAYVESLICESFPTAVGVCGSVEPNMEAAGIEPALHSPPK